MHLPAPAPARPRLEKVFLNEAAVLWRLALSPPTTESISYIALIAIAEDMCSSHRTGAALLLLSLALLLITGEVSKSPLSAHEALRALCTVQAPLNRAHLFSRIYRASVRALMELATLPLFADAEAKPKHPCDHGCERCSGDKR
jgi:hypothetical protein